MRIWDGNIKDESNFLSDKFLTINSCNFQNASDEYTVIRKKGRHDYHILLIAKGECRAVHQGKSYILSSGNLVLYAPGEEQEYSFKVNTSSMWCHFSGSIVSELLDSCSLKSGVYYMPPDKAVCDIFSDMIQRFHQPGRKEFANASFLELIYTISNVKSCSGKYSESDIVLVLFAYINANYNKKITLGDLAEKTGYSKSRVSHLFSEATGTTPIRYLNDIRLENAREMLASTSLTVSEVAVCCGFGDPVHFSKLFKKKYKIAPGGYRKLSGIHSD